MRAETRERHSCPNCHKGFWLIYHQADPDEPQRPVGVACPHCQAVNRQPVASSAAASADYWTEKITP